MIVLEILMKAVDLPPVKNSYFHIRNFAEVMDSSSSLLLPLKLRLTILESVTVRSPAEIICRTHLLRMRAKKHRKWYSEWV